MIAIGNVLLSDEIIEEQFVCDLNKCKGGCCVEGDCGAPLSDEESQILMDIYPKVSPYLPQRFKDEIEVQGTHVIDNEYGKVTPTVNGGICVYAFFDENNIVKCGIEQAHKDGLIDFVKPLSCHLFPIRIKHHDGYSMVNYEPRETLCKPACQLGKKLKLPVYVFLKDSLIRAYGTDFYTELEAVANDFLEAKNQSYI